MSDISFDPAPQPKRVGWGPFAAVIVTLGAFLFGAFAGGFLIGLYPHLRHWDHAHATSWLANSIAAQFFFVLLSESLTIGILWLFLRRRKAKLSALGLTRPRWMDVGYIFFGFLVYFALYIVVVAAVGAAVNLDVNQQQEVGFSNVTGSSAMIMTFISLVILPPLVEEITFRGFLFGGLRTKMNAVAASLITSLLFAAPHLFEGDSGRILWIAGLDTFVLSLVLCYLRYKTGRLWAGIGVHAVKNSIAFIYLFILHVH